MGRVKQLQEELLQKEKLILSLVYFNGWGVMLISQLVALVQLCSETEVPETTIRDRIDRLVEADILRKHRLTGKYYVFVRQSGVDYINSVRRERAKYLWAHPAATPRKQRAILKSVLANGYLIRTLQNAKERDPKTNALSWMNAMRTGSTLWYRDGYNHKALEVYLHYLSDLSEEVKRCLRREIDEGDQKIQKQIQGLESKTPGDQKNGVVNFSKDIELSALAKNYIYLWSVTPRKDTTHVKMIILDVCVGSEGLAGRLYRGLLRCCDVALYYWGDRYKLTVDFVAGTDARAEVLRKLITKEHKRRTRKGLENIELNRRVTWNVVSCGEKGMLRKVV